MNIIKTIAQMLLIALLCGADASLFLITFKSWN